MAQLSNVWESYDAVGMREELSKNIFNITPAETPVLSLIEHGSIKTFHPEWQTETLRTPVTTNNQPEGNEWSFDALSPTVRIGNYAQISDQKVNVSATLDETDKAGRGSELEHQVAKAGKELKTDIEVTILANQASSAGTGNGATNRTSAGLRAWITTNDNMDGGGSSGSFSNGIQSAATNGTQRAFTKAILDAVILSTYNSGGNPNTLIVSPYNKTVFSSFLDDANIVAQRQNVDAKGKRALISSAEIYVSDFGSISVMPNRQMARAGAAVARNAFLIDPDMLKYGVFRDMKVHKVAKTGDAEKRVLNTEWTLLVNNEAAHGCAADLFGLTAAS